MKNSLKIAFCGITTALSVLFMLIGGLISLFAYIMPMLAGVLMIMVTRTFKTSSAVMTYISTSLLSFILVADKECMLMYVLFFGFYPILKSFIEKLKNKSFRLIIKLLLFNVLMLVAQLILYFVFGIPFSENDDGKVLIILFAVMLNILFIVYDIMLNKILIIYEIKLEPRIKKLFK
ncbi:MAG: hypothetical protein NC213_06300 [Acetobacter sp.]|nr:hypothetical protein [Bacteroides sp.]MCM1341336.1 hypothetical protein [Acetobacter sp.]MCM1433428.1 hypothetical protein [Clostridiales bacterium]